MLDFPRLRSRELERIRSVSFDDGTLGPVHYPGGSLPLRDQTGDRPPPPGNQDFLSGVDPIQEVSVAISQIPNRGYFHCAALSEHFAGLSISPTDFNANGV